MLYDQSITQVGTRKVPKKKILLDSYAIPKVGLLWSHRAASGRWNGQDVRETAGKQTEKGQKRRVPPPRFGIIEMNPKGPAESCLVRISIRAN